MGKDTDQIKREIEDMRERMGASADEISGKIDDVRHSIGKTASNIGRRSGDLAHTMIENPLGMALGGLALGLLVGMSMPVTDFERERLGPLADQLKDAVMEKGQDAVERGRDVLQQAASAAVAEVTQM